MFPAVHTVKLKDLRNLLFGTLQNSLRLISLFTVLLILDALHGSLSVFTDTTVSQH